MPRRRSGGDCVLTGIGPFWEGPAVIAEIFKFFARGQRILWIHFSFGNNDGDSVTEICYRYMFIQLRKTITALSKIEVSNYSSDSSSEWATLRTPKKSLEKLKENFPNNQLISENSNKINSTGFIKISAMYFEI